MKRKKLILSLIAVLFIGFSPFLAKSAFADDGISLDVTPEDILFQVENMKPGDWAPRTSVIQNNGQKAFYYSMYIQSEDTNKLFNELLLEITVSETELYNGKLADFENLEERNLEPKEEEELEITIRFPEHLGNDFQGLNSVFSFIFTADSQIDDTSVEVDGFVGSDDDSFALGGSGSSSVGGGGVLPDTATNIFLFLILGAILLVNGILLYMYNKRRKRA
ncbi:hypothetical protein ACDX78_14290 [Virgibacillus oceani]